MNPWKGLLAVAGFVLLAFLERRRPLRRPVEPKLRHEARNLAIAGVGAIAIHLAEAPVVQWNTSLVERRRWGLLQQGRLPRWLETALAAILLDYTMYVWHILLHKVPLFWRFHLPHHADLDLDVSTGLRFHFGELLFSVPLRVAQITLLGTSQRAFSTWQLLFLLSILFHHSGLRLPVKAERRLAWLLTTPRMHGIHHSVRSDEMNSNFSTGLTIWDRVHGTYRCDVPQSAIVIGVPEFRSPEQVTFEKTLTLPCKSLGTPTPV